MKRQKMVEAYTCDCCGAEIDDRAEASVTVRCNGDIYVAANIRSAANRRKNDLQDDPDYSPFAALYAVFCGVRGWPHYEDLLHLADLIDRPTCLDLVEHKQDPFIPGKRMVDGYFHCSDCGWDGQIWEHIGFGDMLAYEAVHCPKCGAIIERRA